MIEGRLPNLLECDGAARDVEKHIVGVVVERQAEEWRIVDEMVVGATAPVSGGEDRIAVANRIETGCRQNIDCRAALDRRRACDV